MSKTKQDNVLETELPLEEWPLTSLREYRLYNEEVRKRNKAARKQVYQIKQCPVDLHPKQRVKFSNNDQSIHPVKVFVSNHLIHFDESLVPGKVYELPECVVSYLADKGYPVWGWVNLPNGEKETQQIAKKPRFSLTTVYQEQQW